jgi:hypothetical protein
VTSLRNERGAEGLFEEGGETFYLGVLTYGIGILKGRVGKGRRWNHAIHRVSPANKPYETKS